MKPDEAGRLGPDKPDGTGWDRLKPDGTGWDRM